MPPQETPPDPNLNQGFLSRAKDYTLHAEIDPESLADGSSPAPRWLVGPQVPPFPATEHSWDFGYPVAGQKPLRVLACRAYQNRYWSLTVRGEGPSGSPARAVAGPDSGTVSGFAPLDPVEDLKTSGGVFTVHDAVEELSGLFRLGDAGEPPSGLLLIAGATNSAKSLIARGLVWKRMTTVADHVVTQVGRPGAEVKAFRIPHLVTLEDPIEDWYWARREAGKKPTPVDRPINRQYLDYTPRELKKDCASLPAALIDALRQTPTVFYIGEIRDIEDWRPVIEFAGTGHLVIATAHAGSVSEAFGRIFKGMKVRTAIDRNYVAEKLRGVVHIRRDQFTGGASTLHALTASVWRRTRSAVHALTADGLTSIAPSCPPLPPYLEHDYTYGRVWWAQTMFRRLQDRNHADIAARVAERLDMKKQVTERMIACDLQGL